MRTRPFLVAADVRTLMRAAYDVALARALEVSIAIVDEGGVLLALQRLDGARLHTPEAAWMKARTAAIVRSATRALEAQVPANPALLSFPGRMPLTGGVPLVHAGHVVGAIGSSGGQPDEDEAVCDAAVGVLRTLDGG